MSNLSNLRNHPSLQASVDALMRDLERESHRGHRFDRMDDLESYTLRRDGFVTARKVA